MRIRVIQSGGLAGLRRECVVETERLPALGRDAYERLVDACAFFDLPERRLTGLPDVVQYRVVIEQSGREHAIVFDDETASEPLRDLVTRALEDQGRA